MAKKCPKCQSDNPGTATFCADCGNQLASLEDIEVTETIEAPKEELTRGTTFAGRYEIIEELGRGRKLQPEKNCLVPQRIDACRHESAE
jgi:predicted amidophosphoribosyltransferase